MKLTKVSDEVEYYIITAIWESVKDEVSFRIIHNVCGELEDLIIIQVYNQGGPLVKEDLR